MTYLVWNTFTFSDSAEESSPETRRSSVPEIAVPLKTGAINAILPLNPHVCVYLSLCFSPPPPFLSFVLAVMVFNVYHFDLPFSKWQVDITLNHSWWKHPI